MKILDVAEGSEVEAVILPITAADFTQIKRGKRFAFDWREPKGSIFKLVQRGSQEILGLVSLIEQKEKESVEIELLEVSKENQGKDKQKDRIAGCLIAYACRLSVKLGFDGWVYLFPKTELMKHYHTKYGFIPFGVCMASDDLNSQKLIKTYL